MNYSDIVLALLIALLAAFLFGVFNARKSSDLLWFVLWALIGTALGESAALLGNWHWLPIGQLYLLPVIGGASIMLFAGQWWRRGRGKKRKKGSAHSGHVR